jgi:hypothetical protein
VKVAALDEEGCWRGYGVGQQKKIAESLAGLGINVDDTLIFELSMLAEGFTTWRGFRKKRPTPADQAERLRKTIAKVEELVKALEDPMSSGTNMLVRADESLLDEFVIPGKIQLLFPPLSIEPNPDLSGFDWKENRLSKIKAFWETAHAEANRAPGPLRQLRDELKRRLDRLTAMSSIKERNRRNRAQIHNEFWDELTQLWMSLTANAPQRRRDLFNFLLACSEPAFLKATKSRALENFVARNFPQRNP